MALLTYADRVAETTTTTSTGTIQLLGALDGKFRTFVAGAGSGNTVPYVIVHRTANEWESGYGVVTSGSPNTLTRAGVYASTNSNTLVNFSAGTKDVFLALPGSKTVRFDDATAAVDVTGTFGTSTTALTITNSSAFSATNIARIDFRANNSFAGTERIAAIWGINPNASANNGGALVFATSGNGSGTTPTERARIDASGNVGIAVTPSAWDVSYKALTINGFSVGSQSASGGSEVTKNSYVASGGGQVYVENGFASKYEQVAGQHIWYTAPSGTAGNAITFTERARIASDGKLTVDAVYTTTVGGTNRDVFVDNTGLIGYVSSIRAAKTNIAPLADTDWLLNLEPVTFNYRKKDEDGNYTDEVDGITEYGLIAEDTEAVNPELCFYDIVDDEPELRGINYSKLIVPMLKRIQSLEARLAALEGA